MAGGSTYALVGNTSTVSVLVTNTGNGNLSNAGTISNLQGSVLSSSGLFTGASVNLLTGTQSGLTDGTSQSITYTFTPTGLGTYSTSITGSFTNGLNNTNSAGPDTATLVGTGVAPVQSVTVSNPNYVLVHSSATSTVTVSNTGNGNLAGSDSATLMTNLHGTQGAASSSVFTGGPGTINLFDTSSVGESTTAGYVYNFAPTQIGATSTTVVSSFINGGGVTNASGSVTSTLSGTGVAPIQTVGSSSFGGNGYVLVQQTAAAAVTIQNVGNGNLAGSGGAFNLNGSVTNTASGVSGATGSSSVSLFDSFGSGAPTSQTYNYTFAPTVKGAVGTGSLVASFSNGSNDGGGQGYNNAQTVNASVVGTGVAPVQTVVPSNTNLGYLLVGSQTATATVTQSNVGNGNLAGSGGIYNLNGSIGNALGGGYTGTNGTTVSLQDSNITATSSTFNYTFAPTVTGQSTTIVTSAFTNGNQDGTNTAQSVLTTITGTGVAPIASISAGTNGYVLVGSSNTAGVTVQDTGNGNLAGTGGGFNLNGSVSATTGSNYNGNAGPTSFSLQDANASGGATTGNYSYTFAPTIIGTSSTVVSATFANGGGNTNSAGSASVTVTGTGVAPIQSVAVNNAGGTGGTANTGNLGYFLVGGQSGTATVTQSNVGDGNLAGTGYPYNLRGSVSNVEDSGFSGGTGGQHIYLQDSNATTGATTSTFTYTFAPTVTGTATTVVTSAFRNGSDDQTNNSQTVTTTLTATGVAPIQTVSGTSTLARFVSPIYGGPSMANAGSATVTVTNTGNGNLAGTGTAYNLNTGSIGLLSGGSVFSPSGSNASSLSLTDSSNASLSYLYTPTARGNNSATVAIAFSNGSNDGTNASQTVDQTISGTGVGPKYKSTLVENPSSGGNTPVANTGTSDINFGNVALGTTVKDLYIYNTTTEFNNGTAELTDLTIESATLSDPASPLTFSIGTYSNYEVTENNGELIIPITLTATGSGSLTDILTITTDMNGAYQGSGDTYYYALNASMISSSAPEPASLLVLGVGLAGLGMARRRRR
jgi:hypothetical protein